MGHGHLVRFQQDVADQPEVQVDVLHARGFVQVLDLGVYRCGELLGGGGVTAAAQQLGALFHGEGNAVGVGVVPIFGCFAGAFKVVRAADAQLAHDAGCAAQQALRGPGQLRVGERRLVDAVAAEELVGAFTGKHRLDLRSRDLVHEVQRHSRRVGGRLVHVPLHAGQAFPVLVLADVLVGVGDVQLVGKLVGPRDLVAHHAAGALGVVGGGVLIAIKAHGERFDVGVFLRQACRHVAGVDARGQEAADLDVGHVVVADAVAHGFVDGLDGILSAALRIEVVLGAPIAALGDGPVGVHGHAVRGSQLEDALEEGFGKGAELEAQVLLERFTVELARVVRMLEDALDLGCEDEAAVLLRVVKRLDAEEVARTEQLARIAVPDGEREHAAQAVEHAFAPCQIAREQDLGVGVGLELPALRLKLGAQVAVVVDLAVEHDGVAALGGCLLGRAARGAVKVQRRRGDDGGVVARGAHHGLVAVGKVDEREAAVA